MKAADGLLLLFLPLCYGYGVETSCDGRQNNTKCYGPLGGSIVIQLLNHTSTISKFKWLFKSRVILEMSRGEYVVNELNDRSAISNETITLHNLNWNDAGNYTLDTFTSEGVATGKWILQLMIQAPVSSVWMTSQCLSQGETKVFCHPLGGDSPFKYSWSLDGVPHDSSENDSSSITLEQGEPGSVVCNISNQVNTASAGQTISGCVFINCTFYNGTYISNWLPRGADENCETTATPTSSTGGKETFTNGHTSNKPSTNITTSSQTTTDAPWYIQHMTVMAAVLSVLVILLLLATAFVCVHKKRHIDKGQDSQELGLTQVKDEQELTYADVNILRGRKVPQMKEQDVEYGQINISHRPRRIDEPKEDECVYAKVRVAR